MPVHSIAAQYQPTTIADKNQNDLLLDIDPGLCQTAISCDMAYRRTGTFLGGADDGQETVNFGVGGNPGTRG